MEDNAQGPFYTIGGWNLIAKNLGTADIQTNQQEILCTFNGPIILT